MGIRRLRFVLGLLFTAGIFVNVACATYRILTCEPAARTFAPFFEIDSVNFIRSGKQMKESGRLFYPPEYHHSAGAQIVMALWFALGGTENYLGLKLGNLGLWIFSALLVSLSVKILLADIIWGLFAGWFFTHSALLSQYTGVLQYEMILVFLASLAIYLQSLPPTVMRATTTGAVLAFSACFRFFHVVLIGPTLVYYLILGDRRRTAFFALGFLSLSVPWTLLHCLNLQIYNLHDFLAIVPPFEKHLHAGANPFNYPYAESRGPHGLRFIAAFPRQYLHLLWERAQYLVGTRADTWFVESRWTRGLENLGVGLIDARHWTVTAGTFLASVGLARPVNPRVAAFCAILIFTGFFPHLFVGTSTRFLVPLLPAIFTLQIFAIKRGTDIVLRLQRASFTDKSVPTTNGFPV